MKKAKLIIFDPEDKCFKEASERYCRLEYVASDISDAPVILKKGILRQVASPYSIKFPYVEYKDYSTEPFYLYQIFRIQNSIDFIKGDEDE